MKKHDKVAEFRGTSDSVPYNGVVACQCVKIFKKNLSTNDENKHNIPAFPPNVAQLSLQN